MIMMLHQPQPDEDCIVINPSLNDFVVKKQFNPKVNPSEIMNVISRD